MFHQNNLIKSSDISQEEDNIILELSEIIQESINESTQSEGGEYLPMAMEDINECSVGPQLNPNETLDSIPEISANNIETVPAPIANITETLTSCSSEKIVTEIEQCLLSDQVTMQDGDNLGPVIEHNSNDTNETNSATQSIMQDVEDSTKSTSMLPVVDAKSSATDDSSAKHLDPTAMINPPVQQLPIKINNGPHQSIFMSNQVIGSNMPSIAPNTFSSISYILPSNSLNKQQTVVQKGSTLNMAPNLVASNIATNNTMDTTLIHAGSGGNILDVNDNNNHLKCSNVKLIQTSPGHLVFPSIKNVAGGPSVSLVETSGKSIVVNPNANQISMKNSGKNMASIGNVDVSLKTSTTYVAPSLKTSTAYVAPSLTTITNANHQQQLIILSPVKTAPSQTSKPSTFIPYKLLPNAKLPNIGSTVPGTSSTAGKKVIASATKTINDLMRMSASAKNVQYISFVPMSSNNQINTTTTSKLVPLKPSTTASTNKMTTASSSCSILKPNMVQIGQKVLINPSSIKISTTVASTISASTVSQSTTSTGKTHTNSKNSATSIWMLPKQIKVKNDNSTNVNHSSKAAASSTKFVPIAPNPNQMNSGNYVDASKVQVAPISKLLAENYEESRRKACNCTRSQCLKLYCDCFANGEFCNNCNCLSCCNNLEWEETRQKAIRLCLERNPNAFHPKIGHQGDVERRHTKGCCCKRSGCLKNYCECYEAKILCSDKCKCVGCKNFEESAERKTLVHLADAAEAKSTIQQSVASKLHVWGPDFKPKLPVKVKSDCHPFNVLTDDILAATASCLLAQAEEAEFENLSEENIEELILDQFGECLSQILNLANNGMSEEFDANSEDDDNMNDDMDSY